MVYYLRDDPDERVRFNAARALERIGGDSELVRETLQAALKDEDEDVRYWASEALKKIGTS